MDNQRIILFLALAIVVLFLWNAWEHQHQPPQHLVAGQSVQPAATSKTKSTQTASTDSSVPTNDIPEVGAKESVVEPKSVAQEVTKSGQRIHVTTDVLDVDLDTVGGDIRRALMLKYPISLSDKEPFPLMIDKMPKLFIAQSGFLSNTSDVPNHLSTYKTEKTNYQLSEGKDQLSIPMVWQSKDGKITVTKTYIFHRGSYLIDVKQKVTNNSNKEWRARTYKQIQRTEFDAPNKARMVYTFTGAAISTPDTHYEKIKFKNMADWKSDKSFSKGGWIAMVQHYFVTAWIPAKNEENHIFSRNINGTRYVIGMTGNEQVVQANGSKTFNDKYYAGPKDQDRLKGIAANLDLTVDYGILTVIANPLFWLLKWYHGVFGNWGWAIIVLTLTIKLLFFKLSETSYRSMANMRKISPKFQAIRERYGDDKQRMSQAMMELYKKEKVNPMSGCWPMLVQIPVFISLYWVLLGSVQIRMAPFIFWIHDLSTKDPFYVLPVLMGATMFFQQKLSANPSLDPMHQKVMQFLPIVFTMFFMMLPAGLVLYYVVNSVLSILQQWYITRKIERSSA